MIFNTKQEDFRYKAWLVAGGYNHLYGQVVSRHVGMPEVWGSNPLKGLSFEKFLQHTLPQRLRRAILKALWDGLLGEGYEAQWTEQVMCSRLNP